MIQMPLQYADKPSREVLTAAPELCRSVDSGNNLAPPYAANH
jgi:hypothetical protein